MQDYNDDRSRGVASILALFSCPDFRPIVVVTSKTTCDPLMSVEMVFYAVSSYVDGFGPSVTSFGYRCVNCLH